MFARSANSHSRLRFGYDLVSCGFASAAANRPLTSRLSVSLITLMKSRSVIAGAMSLGWVSLPVCIYTASVHAAPLAWFPGPSMDWPVSGAATVADRSLGNLIVGGDSYYVESLVATNIYWT